jgi:hypothetical protein
MAYDGKKFLNYITCPSCEMRSTRYGNVVRHIQRLHNGVGKPVRSTASKLRSDSYVTSAHGTTGAAVRPWDVLRSDLLSMRRKVHSSAKNPLRNRPEAIENSQTAQVDEKLGTAREIIFGYTCANCKNCCETLGSPIFFNDTGVSKIEELWANHICDDAVPGTKRIVSPREVSVKFREANRAKESGESLRDFITGTYPSVCPWAGHDLYVYAKSLGYDLQATGELTFHTFFDQLGLDPTLHSKYGAQNSVWYSYKAVLNKIERCRDLEEMINKEDLGHWSCRALRNVIVKLSEPELLEFCKVAKDSTFKVINLSYKTLMAIDYPYDRGSSYGSKAGKGNNTSAYPEWFIVALTPYPHIWGDLYFNLYPKRNDPSVWT